MSLRFGCSSSLLWFEVRKWHVALHSFAGLIRSLPYLSRMLLRGLTGDRGQGRSFPFRTGFPETVFKDQPTQTDTHPAGLACENILVLGFLRDGWRNAAWIQSVFPFSDCDTGWEPFLPFRCERSESKFKIQLWWMTGGLCLCRVALVEV